MKFITIVIFCLLGMIIAFVIDAFSAEPVASWAEIFIMFVVWLLLTGISHLISMARELLFKTACANELLIVLLDNHPNLQSGSIHALNHNIKVLKKYHGVTHIDQHLEKNIKT